MSLYRGNPSAREQLLAAGATQYIDYTKENYWEILKGVDFVIDTLGAAEFDRELSIIKSGGRLLSLRTGPNKQFAKDQGFPKWKQLLFALAGAKFDKKAKKHGVEYRFIFVRSNGSQLEEISKIIEENNIIPAVDPTEFTLNQVNEALRLVASGHPKGKVVIKFRMTKKKGGRISMLESETIFMPQTKASERLWNNLCVP